MGPHNWELNYGPTPELRISKPDQDKLHLAYITVEKAIESSNNKIRTMVQQQAFNTYMRYSPMLKCQLCAFEETNQTGDEKHNPDSWLYKTHKGKVIIAICSSCTGNWNITSHTTHSNVDIQTITKTTNNHTHLTQKHRPTFVIKGIITIIQKYTKNHFVPLEYLLEALSFYKLLPIEPSQLQTIENIFKMLHETTQTTNENHPN
jgi:hypothetical protein